MRAEMSRHCVVRVTLSALSISINIKPNGKMGADATTDNCVRIAGAFNCDLLMMELLRSYKIHVHFIIIHMYRTVVVFSHTTILMRVFYFQS